MPLCGVSWPAQTDLFAVAEAIGRQVVVFSADRGWHVARGFVHH
jgi:hypothetical protein